MQHAAFKISAQSDLEAELVTNEAQALSEILVWSEACPLWQKDALRRLCMKGMLSGEDVEALEAICKGDATGAEPLAKEHSRDPQAAAAVVTLRGIREVENVNALAEEQHLTFDKSGVTIIYGDNGSGKSGFARVLKKVCRARTSKKNNILHNIYATTVGPQKAAVDFTVNGQNRHATWTGGAAADPLLSSVSVFDGRTANVHVDETNDVAYTPFPMKVLEGLAQAVQEIKSRIVAQVEALERQTPAALRQPECSAETAVGQLVAKLDGGTNPETVRRLALLSDKEKARLASLRAELADDPAKAARRLRSLKSRVEAAAASITALTGAAADKRAAAFAALYLAHKTAAAAAAVAATDLFAGEPLPQVGSDIWRALWEAARAFSEQQAYRDQPFPVTEEGARCVLCHQELNEEARARLQSFEAFVKARSKREEERTRAAYQAEYAELAKADMSIEEARNLAALCRDELNDQHLAAEVRQCILTAKWRLRRIFRTHGNDLAGLPPLVPPPAEAMAGYAADFEARAVALVAEGEADERRRLEAQCRELADRQWLAIVQEDVIAEISRHKQADDLKAALKDTATNRITTKSSEIAEKLVTKTLRTQFAKEIARLRAAGLAIELRRQQASYGIPRFRVCLVQKPDQKVGDVLSEGEHRCVALAAFMAELSTTESRSAIVFDDPVSSLDHMHREVMAARLAAEGKRRQIIVFTHDLAFLFLLNAACQDEGTHVGFRSVTRGEEFAGFCHQDAPQNAQPVDRVIESIQKHLNNKTFEHAQGQRDAWYLTVRSLQEQLRTTWERAVEEAVAPVLKRLSNKVNTLGLAKLTAITAEDCKAMRAAYARCSKLLHSSPEVLNPPLPKPDAVQAEIDALRDWVAGLKARQAQIGEI
jgi:energy-coupling factor transporter ATP-binding protein EcfA2